MGAWGTGLFDNDDAADWAYELDEATDLTPVRRALAGALDTTGYLDLAEGAPAIAAAAVVASCLDADVGGLPEEVVTWLRGHPGVATTDDARLAVRTLERVTGEESELQQLWAEAPEGPEWAREVGRLEARLIAAGEA